MIVDDSHFAYLALQKGSLDHLKDDRAAWLAAYEASLEFDLATMMPFLPHKCASILDIGSGLGGIDVMLNRHYGGGLKVRLLDGVDDPPEMRLHRKTFNDMRVAEDFQNRNGVLDFGFYSPAAAAANMPSPIKFDLIISLGSWGFHYAPKIYMHFVRQVSHGNNGGTVLIADLRNGKPHWCEQIRYFDRKAVALSRPKFERVVYGTNWIILG